MTLAMVLCSIETDQEGTPHARARVNLVSREGRSHASLFMVPLGLPNATPMTQALRLPFENLFIIYKMDHLSVKRDELTVKVGGACIFKVHGRPVGSLTHWLPISTSSTARVYTVCFRCVAVT